MVVSPTIRVVESSWLEKHIDDSQTRIIDPRPRVKYLQGHIPRAVNVSLSEVFDKSTLALHSENKLGEIFGAVGVDLESKVVLYDSYDGQSAALLAWLLESLGQPEVSVLSDYLESWAKHGGKILYRPVTNQSTVFNEKPGQPSRANINEVIQRGSSRLLDLRGQDEFVGKISNEPRSGHIPGSINLPWTELIGKDNNFLRSPSELKEVFSNATLKDSDQIITYCSYGPRAALGYIALQEAGFKNVRVYDGSFHQWSQRMDLPVTTSREGVEKSVPQALQAPPCIIDKIPDFAPAE